MSSKQVNAQDVIDGLDDPTYLEEYILKRLYDQNKNFITAITGPTGSGKSYSALRLAERIDADFSIDNVVFNAQDLLLRIKQGKEQGELEQGSVLVFDEAGVEANSRDWQSKTNKALNYLFQTMRSYNFMVILTLPHIGGLDKQIRQLLHAFMPTQGIDYKHSTVELKPLFFQVNQQTGEIFKKFLKVFGDDGETRKIRRHHVKMPTKELRDAYEERKESYQEDLYSELLEDVMDDLDTLTVESGEELTDKQAGVAWLCMKGLNQHEVAEVLDVTHQNVSKHVDKALEKGWQFPHKDGDHSNYGINPSSLDEHDTDYLQKRASKVTHSEIQEVDLSS